jgi:DnaJ domain
MTVLYGVAAVALLWGLANLLAQANIAALARALRVVGGVLALGAAVMIGLRGRIDIALALGGLGAWLLGWSSLGMLNFGRRAQQASGRVSRVRSIMLEMELDHDTGEMDGTVSAGAFAGQRLNALDQARLRALMAECHAGDLDGVRLLEAYLDRRFPTWRETAEDHAHHRPDGTPASSAMTEDEAYQILGLQPDASSDQVRHAHRMLLKKLHPDQGGTTYLAAQVNRAKDVLLKRRR